MGNKPVIFKMTNVFCNRLLERNFEKKEVVGDSIISDNVRYYQFEQSIAGAVFPVLKLSEEMYLKMKKANIEQKEVDLTFIFKVKNNKYVAEIFDFELSNK